MSVYRGDPSKIGRPIWTILPPETSRTRARGPVRDTRGVDVTSLIRDHLQDIPETAQAAGTVDARRAKASGEDTGS